jgi:hypothetical protein
MMIADDEAASGAPERFAFRQRANIAQAFGHDAAGMGEISMPIMVRIFLMRQRVTSAYFLGIAFTTALIQLAVCPMISRHINW